MLLRDDGRAGKKERQKTMLYGRSANKRQKLQCRTNRNPPPVTNSTQSSQTNWLWNLADSETESESDADFWTFIWQMAYATGNICSTKWGWRRAGVRAWSRLENTDDAVAGQSECHC